MNLIVEYMGLVIYDNYDTFMNCNDGAIRNVVEDDNKIKRMVCENYPNFSEKHVTSFYLATLLYLFMTCENKY